MLYSELADYVGARTTDMAVVSCLWAAHDLVAGYLAGYGLVLVKTPWPSATVTFPNGETFVPFEPFVDGIPDHVVRRAVLEVGAELFHRRTAKNGVTQFAVSDVVSPVRIARDPLVAARPMLAPFLTRGGFV